MTGRALTIYMGQAAAQRVAECGWSASLFSLLLGASGGPKWFILAPLDRVLFGSFLQQSDHPLSTLGSSIGSWRNSCLALEDPAAAIARLEAAYLAQEYSSERPAIAEISEASRGIIMHMLGESGGKELLTNRRIHTHIVTARGRGAAGASPGPVLASAMAAAALGNSVDRRLLRLAFQRVVFHSSGPAKPGLSLEDFKTSYVRLNPDNLPRALHASGAIPFVLSGERDIPGAPRGQYWDGGIIDYHFDLAQYRGEGLVLYPHFRADITPGWFDKFLPWRRRSPDTLDRLVLLCPSREFVASLPHGKIPDRNDFRRFSHSDRVRYWQNCIARAQELADEFAEQVAGADPLRGVTVLP